MCFATQEAKAQDRPIVQVSGLIMNADSTQSIPGVHIFNPASGRGDISDYKGWFSRAFLAGDSLVVSAIGFKNLRLIVPDDVGDHWTVIFSMEEEITQLDDVEVNPFPTEELFKEAILAMNLTNDQENIINNFSPEVIQELIRTTPLTASPSSNYRYMLNQQYDNLRYGAGPRSNPLLNPFAWGQFIKSLKKKKKR